MFFTLEPVIKYYLAMAVHCYQRKKKKILYSFWTMIFYLFFTGLNQVSGFHASPSDLFSTAKLDSHLASIFRSREDFTAADRAKESHLSHAGLGPPKNLSGWQEMCMQFPHQTAGWGMVFVYCEGRSTDGSGGPQRHSHLSVEPDFFERSVDTEDQRFCVHTWVCEA